MKLVTRMIILSIPAILASCSHISKPQFIQNRETAFLNAKSIPPLRVPPGLSSSAFNNHYPVSSREYTLTKADINVEPPGLYDK